MAGNEIRALQETKCKSTKVHFNTRGKSTFQYYQNVASPTPFRINVKSSLQARGSNKSNVRNKRSRKGRPSVVFVIEKLISYLISSTLPPTLMHIDVEKRPLREARGALMKITSRMKQAAEEKARGGREGLPPSVSRRQL